MLLPLPNKLHKKKWTYHDFTVLLFVYVLITEHVAGTQDSQFARILHLKKSNLHLTTFLTIWLEKQSCYYTVPLTLP